MKDVLGFELAKAIHMGFREMCAFLRFSLVSFSIIILYFGHNFDYSQRSLQYRALSAEGEFQATRPPTGLPQPSTTRALSSHLPGEDKQAAQVGVEM